MNLPLLPLKDGALYIDNSTLELLTTCPRSHEYAKLHARILNASKPALNFGSAGHLVWEHRYKTYGQKQPDAQLENEQSAILQEFFAKNPVQEDEQRNLNLAQEIFITRYNRRYSVEPFNLLADKDGKAIVELPFTVPLFTWKGILPFSHNEGITEVPIIYIGRIDLPVIWDGDLFIGDHKTTGMLGAQYFDEAQLSPQQLGYCWAFEQCTGQDVKGYFINAVRTKNAPAKPKEGLDKWWEEGFQRQKYYLRPGQLVEWKFNTIALIEEFFWNYQRDYMPMKQKWCVGKYGKCQFFNVCTLPESQRLQMLNSAEYQVNDWSPLKQNT